MVDVLVGRIVEQGELKAGERIALMVNNLGGTAVQELDIVARRALLACAAQGLRVEAVMVGTFLTALEMAGCSLSILRVDDSLLTRLKASTDATAWRGMTTPGTVVSRVPVVSASEQRAFTGTSWSSDQAEVMRKVIQAVSQALQQNEHVLTELDSVVGDGDIGISLARGARAIDAALESLALGRPAVALQQLSAVLRRVLGGTSGPLYAVFVLRAGVALSEHAEPGSVAAWAEALQAGCDGMVRLGGASAGDRTMLDALIPAAAALSSQAKAVAAADAAAQMAMAAEIGAEATRTMLPSKGRSSYLGERALGHVDPGAYAVVLWMRAVAGALDD
jgi:dihydroxyacetone kinase